MSPLVRVVGIALRLIVAPACFALALAAVAAANAGVGLDGVWEGSLTVASAPSTGEKPEQFGLRV